MGDGRPAFGPSCNEFVYPACWNFDNGETSKIDNVLTEHVGLLRVLPLAVHLNFVLIDKAQGPLVLVFGFRVWGLGPGLDNCASPDIKCV